MKQANSYITSDNHLFSKCITSNRQSGNMKDCCLRENFLKSLKLLPENLITANQTHSANIAIVQNSDKNTVIENCDGLITADKDIILGIFTADCMPVFMISDDKRVRGAIHSGWKGLSAGILEKTVEIFKNEFVIAPENINVYIGPHIKECCYEVGEEFEKIFNTKLADNKINLAEIAANKLKKTGIQNVFISTHCTFHEKETFYSYRREKTDNRQINIFA